MVFISWIKVLSRHDWFQSFGFHRSQLVFYGSMLCSNRGCQSYIYGVSARFGTWNRIHSRRFCACAILQQAYRYVLYWMWLLQPKVLAVKQLKVSCSAVKTSLYSFLIFFHARTSQFRVLICGQFIQLTSVWKFAPTFWDLCRATWEQPPGARHTPEAPAGRLRWSTGQPTSSSRWRKRANYFMVSLISLFKWRRSSRPTGGGRWLRLDRTTLMHARSSVCVNSNNGERALCGDEWTERYCGQTKSWKIYTWRT